MTKSTMTVPLLRNRALVSAALALLVFASVWLLQRLGTFQFLELFVYDRLIRSRAPVMPADPRIILLEVTEDDIHKYDFPLPDVLLAKVLESVAAQGPRAIGVDIYRDVPVPRDGSGKAELERVLAANPNIIWTFNFGDSRHGGVAPPSFFESAPERIGFNDYPVDNQTIRRGLLFLDDGKNSFESFPLKLVELYLGGENPSIGPEPDPANPQLLRLGRTTFHPFQPTDGPYIKSDAGGYQFFLDFAGPREFTIYPLDDFLKGRAPAGFARDRIVLIGSTAGSLKDFMVTPLRFDEPGVQLHAQTINQLLRAALTGHLAVRTWSDARETAWLLLWCVLGTLTAFLIRGPVRLTGALLVAGGVLWFIVSRGFTHGWWIPFSPPLVANLAAAGLVITYIAHVERKERGVLMEIFKRNVSPRVAESLWAQREQFTEHGRPRPQKLIATVLFTDLKDFTTVSEKLDPPALMDWLNGYMEVMAAQVDECGGVVISYIGDAIMAAFGAPVPHEREEEIDRDAVDAVRCAVAMRRALVKLNAERAAAGAPLTQMRVGIFTGPVVAGCLGATNRLAYTTLGNTTNTASRLESFDKDLADPELPPTDCRILIGGTTECRLGQRFLTKRLPGNKKLKGKEEEITVFWVIDEITPEVSDEKYNSERARAPRVEPASAGNQ